MAMRALHLVWLALAVYFSLGSPAAGERLGADVCTFSAHDARVASFQTSNYVFIVADTYCDNQPSQVQYVCWPSQLDACNIAKEDRCATARNPATCRSQRAYLAVYDSDCDLVLGCEYVSTRATPTPTTPAPTPATPAPTTPATTPATPAPTPATPAPTTPAPTPATPAPTPATPAPTTPAPTPATPAPTPATPVPTPATPAPTILAPTPTTTSTALPSTATPQPATPAPSAVTGVINPQTTAVPVPSTSGTGKMASTAEGFLVFSMLSLLLVAY